MMSCLRPWIILLLAAVATTPVVAETPVGMVVRQYVDASRPNWRSAGPRPELTVIWYPAPQGTPVSTAWDRSPEPFAGSFVIAPLAPDAPLSRQHERYPVVLLSHGATSVPWSLTWLGTSLAAHGYIAAAVAHHGDTGLEGQPLPQGFILMSERAKDISFVLDRLLADTMFRDHIARDRIYAAGHSSGGETVIELAGGIFDPANLRQYCHDQPASMFCSGSPQILENVHKFEALQKQDAALAKLYAEQNRSYRDARIRKVVALAPAVGPGFTEQGLASVQIPVLIFAGSADRVTPPDEHAEHYAKLIRGAKLVIIPHADHFLFGGECTDAGKRKLAMLCVDDPSVDRHKVLQEIAAQTLDFFNH